MKITINVGDMLLRKIIKDANNNTRTEREQILYILSSWYDKDEMCRVLLRARLDDVEKSLKKINNSEETAKLLKDL
jgi:hypothetical protein